MHWKALDLKISLKPFIDNSNETMESTCRKMFSQWASLARESETVDVLLWVGDGSEILDYNGQPDASFEWGYWIGKAEAARISPEKRPIVPKTIHSWPQPYRKTIPLRTYRWLHELVATIKATGAEITQKPVRAGIAFDPGPEFVLSDFKYRRHPEICSGHSMGANTFVSCASHLVGDSRPYAGFPGGIPDGTAFGVFLGRQVRLFTTDLGFDYIWFSNGFAFSANAWNTTGPLFDGNGFHPEEAAKLQAGILGFWRDFCRECPALPIKARGTNLTLGTDLASNGVPLGAIYRHCPDRLTPPPNSPWAPINGNLGLELTGWMTRIADLPGRAFPFRYYIHDPWFLNSPWLDRYGRQPYDLFLPSCITRLDATGACTTPDELMLLSTDNSHGELPDEVPTDVISLIKNAFIEAAPDSPGPVIWIYPADEYQAFRPEETGFDLPTILAGDWFICGAVNEGLPLNTVISSTHFIECSRQNPDTLAGRILLCPVPAADSPLSEALKTMHRRGNDLLLYGAARRMDDYFANKLGLKEAPPVEGTGEVRFEGTGGSVSLLNGREKISMCYHHQSLVSGGGLGETLATRPNGHLFAAEVVMEDQIRVVAIVCNSPGDAARLGWVRGTTSLDFTKMRSHLPTVLPRDEFFTAESLARHALASFGYEIGFARRFPTSPTPVIGIKRHDNGFHLCACNPDLTVETSLSTPCGAPVPIGMDGVVSANRTHFHFSRSVHVECRIFVRQEQESILSCSEKPSIDPSVRRRLSLSGLKHAEVIFFPEADFLDSTRCARIRIPGSPQVVLPDDILRSAKILTPEGWVLKLSDVSGDIQFFW